MMKIVSSKRMEWRRMPSVTRPGRFFFVTGDRAAGTQVTVSQSFLTGGWMIQHQDKEPFGDYRSANEAKGRAFEIYGSK